MILKARPATNEPLGNFLDRWLPKDLDELIQYMYRQRAIIRGPKSPPPAPPLQTYDIVLRDIIYSDHHFRCSITALLLDAIIANYGDSFETHQISLIGVSRALAPVIGIISHLIKCPIIAVVPEQRDYSKMRIIGRPPAGHRYVLIDDTLKTGKTISKAIDIWISIGLPIDLILVFCDKQEGGQKEVERKIRNLRRQHKLPKIATSSIITMDRIQAVIC